MATPASDDTAAASAQVARQIKELLKQVNNNDDDDRADAARLDELRRIFAKLAAAGDLQQPGSSAEARAKWHAFLRSSHQSMVEQLKQRIVQGKRTALRTLWGVVATTPAMGGSDASQQPLVDLDLLVHWVAATTRTAAAWDQSIHHMIQAEFLQPYRDVQYYTLKAIQRVAQRTLNKNHPRQQHRVAERLVEMLTWIPLAKSQAELDNDATTSAYLFPPSENAVPDENNESDDDDDDSQQDSNDDDDDDNSSIDPDDSSDESEGEEPAAKRPKLSRKNRFKFEQVRAHRREWSKAWMTVLKLDLPTSALKQALQFLPTHVLPVVTSPLLFADFFIQAYQHAGVVPILALDGLFVLLTQHGLEYPDYYKQLYRLVTPTLFYVRYRTRFFRLLDRSIARNDLLPAATVAAFCKRLLRASLQAPPAGIMTALALSSNWLRKHPETLVLVHSSATSTSTDPFDATADDPAASRALQSSLWELHALQQHYLPAVVTLAAAVGSPAQDEAPLLDLEDFYSQSYHNLLEQERKRSKKKTPLTFQPPKQLFDASDVFGDILEITQTELPQTRRPKE